MWRFFVRRYGMEYLAIFQIGVRKMLTVKVSDSAGDIHPLSLGILSKDKDDSIFFFLKSTLPTTVACAIDRTGSFLLWAELCPP